jgi:WD repeat-containing protein 59
MAESDTQKSLVSAFDSVTFGVDTSIRVDQPVGSMSISPCGRDVVLASYVLLMPNTAIPEKYR